MFVHHTRAPLGRRHPNHNKCAVVLGAVKDKPSRVALTRHPLTAPARAGLSPEWVGARKPDSKIAVETVIAHRPPHRSVRAQLRHTVLTSSI
jgi:hypothetical protein